MNRYTLSALLGAVALVLLGVSWGAGFEADPLDGDNISDGAEEIRTTRDENRFRHEVEHHFGTFNTNDNGLHWQGSARTFYQDTEPTALGNARGDYNQTSPRATGETLLTAAPSQDGGNGGSEILGTGRMWVDLDNFIPHFYNGARTDFIAAPGVQNILHNGSFSAQVGGAGSAPDGWTLVSAPATVAVQASPTAEASSNELNLVATGAAVSEGVTQTLAGVGLRPTTNYRVMLRAQEGTGNCLITTTGGGTNISLSPTGAGASTWETLTGVVITNSTPSDIVFNLLSDAASAATDDCDFANVRIWEESGASGFPAAGGWPGMVVTQDSVAQNQSFTTTPASVNNLATEVTPPGPGYIVLTYGHITLSNTNIAAPRWVDVTIIEGITECSAARIELGEDSSGSTGNTDHISLMCATISPTPGTALTYNIQVDGEQTSVIQTIATEGEARLITLMMPVF